MKDKWRVANDSLIGFGSSRRTDYHVEQAPACRRLERDPDVKRIACGVALLLITCSPLRAQDKAIDELKGKIFDARMAQQTFGEGLKYCPELNGKTFYFRVRNRILDLEEYFRSLESLVKAQVFNPEKRRPWSMEDAKERWEAVKKQAQEDKEKCELVKSLPELEKRLQELQKNSAATEHKGLKSLQRFGIKRIAPWQARCEGFTGRVVCGSASAAKGTVRWLR
jgi:hypothetical protein